ncbi:hypothetical protein SAMN02910358_01094 [Lachnospiraceae bacterium XBB1006]|nr:hypothetical protein SAMN02910358_01094 [Lachnospiraceae bacterium XBB1006]
MVEGIQSFREKFKDYEANYTIIGGAACDILMAEADIDFRLTKDLDIILILEDSSEKFAKVFWEYIKEAGYKCGWKNSEKMHFYRFTEPKPGYPIMIELFSRKPGYQLEVEEGIIPIHIDDDVSSLSAILLNDDFYNFMMEGRTLIDGISVLRAEYLIPFKMYAWLDLGKRKQRGEHVNDRDFKKHKNDVFRLLQIINPEEKIISTGLVKDSIEEFLDKMKSESIRVEQLGLNISQEDALKVLHNVYQ